jgi:phosphatidylserine decarboxylase
MAMNPQQIQDGKTPSLVIQAKRRILWRITVLFLSILTGMIGIVIMETMMVVPIYALVLAWLVMVVFTMQFFRDPNPRVPQIEGIIVAPAHGKIDMMDELDEPEFMRGRCHRISIFLSIFDVHVQNAPVAGFIEVVSHKPGRFFNAMNAIAAAQNESLLVGFRLQEKPHEKIGVRLIAGFIARRIVPWVDPGNTVAQGERIGLIQFGSRCDLYLPLTFQIQAKLGDRVVAGETIVATRNKKT